MNKQNVWVFLQESLAIEGIYREVSKEEVDATYEFIFVPDEIEIEDLIKLLKVYQPNAALRSKDKMDVRVGPYFPPKGGRRIELMLKALLKKINNYQIKPFDGHCEFEKIHPFTDGNGRVGRALWASHMHQLGLDPFALPFLHKFYYQSLDAYRKNKPAK